jgi:hypothetical protein
MTQRKLLDLELEASQNPEYQEGWQANQKGHGYPPHFINTISLEFRLGWISAERLDILNEMKENSNGIP